MKYKNAILVGTNKSDRLVAFPPAITQKSTDGKWGKSQINDTTIESFRRLFT